MISDCMVQVKCEALYSVTSLLTSFNEVPRYETRLFIDYLFPRLVRFQYANDLLQSCLYVYL